MRFFLSWISTAIAFWVTAALLPGIEMTTNFQSLDQQWATLVGYLVLSLIFGLVNAFIGPVLRVLSLPLTCLTLGLFSLVINGLLLLLTGWVADFTPVGLEISSFWMAMVAGVMISIVTGIVQWAINTAFPSSATS